METPIKIALSKGRIFKEALPLLAHAGIEPLDDPETSRKLILDTNQDAIKLVVIRAADVPTYVRYGAADLGIAGKDVLMEHGGDDLYEPLDLKIACCRMMVAGPENYIYNNINNNDDNFAFAQTGKRLKIATKYIKSTQRYFAEKGIQVEIIKLYGSMELGPIVGLSDLIVDLVDTGNTLKANGLAPLEHITNISSRLIVNKASMKMKDKVVKHLINSMSDAVNKLTALTTK
ncbi:MAG: ATP phosphoribosyltransferase [Gammaproteobacteria bacterium]|nr:ATP phosphoribosyltransferase [Gammaproteobacteria bacterium]